MENNQLTHWGVKGMRWGVRKDRDSGGGGTKRVSRKVRKQREANLKKARETREAKKQLAAKKEEILRSGKAKDVLKNRNLFTNDELQRAIDRLDLEQKLSKANDDQISRGRKFTEKILERAGENLITQVVNHYGAKALNSIINERDQKGDRIDVIFANNKKKG